jgi:hypothetical protein
MKYSQRALKPNPFTNSGFLFCSICIAPTAQRSLCKTVTNSSYNGNDTVYVQVLAYSSILTACVACAVHQCMSLEGRIQSKHVPNSFELRELLQILVYDTHCTHSRTRCSRRVLTVVKVE